MSSKIGRQRRTAGRRDGGGFGTPRSWSMTGAAMARATCRAGPTDTAGFRGLAARLPRERCGSSAISCARIRPQPPSFAAGLPGPDPIPGPGVQVELGLAEQHFGEWQGRPMPRSPSGRLRSITASGSPRRANARPAARASVDLIERVVPVIDRLKSRACRTRYYRRCPWRHDSGCDRLCARSFARKRRCASRSTISR